MGKVYQAIDERLREFILAQPVFFVATAPSGDSGHVNVSPKGLRGSLAVLSPLRVAYLDYGGSGAETVAHLRDNGRITVMFCAFDGPPKVLRLHGRGRAVYRTDPECASLLAHFDDPAPGLRAVVDVEVTRVSDSCGFGVPLMSYAGDRDLLPRYWERRTDDEILAYHAQRNASSVDGLPVWDG
ncbi:MAG TPA: pyridoxamine 5'-phosphate oxidase family protein [Micromonosporaceae bacterium]